MSDKKRKQQPLSFVLPDPKRRRLDQLHRTPAHINDYNDTVELAHVNAQAASGEAFQPEPQPYFIEEERISARVEQRIKAILSTPNYLPTNRSELQEVLINAKYGSSNTDPRFVPIPLENQDSLKVSLVINLYDSGFSFDDQEVAYQYSRANQSVADTVNLGILPGQIDQILQRHERLSKDAAAASAAQGSQTPRANQIVFYDGGIIIEVRDYRDGRAIYDEITHSVKPLVFKLYTKPDMHALHYHLDSLHGVHPRFKIFIEQGILNNIHPRLCLDPSTDVHRLAHAMYYNIQKFNINPRIKSLRRRLRIVPRRAPIKQIKTQPEFPPLPIALPSGLLHTSQLLPQPAGAQINIAAVAQASQPTPTAPEQPEKKPKFVSKLFNFLQQLNHSSFSKETIQQQQQTRLNVHDKHAVARRLYLPTPEEPVPKNKPENQYPTVSGRFFFAPPVRPGLPQMPPPPTPNLQDFIVLDIKGSTPVPHEFYIAQLKLGSNAKPVSITLGGPNAAQTFLNQIRKLETPATAEQVKMIQQRALQQQQQQQQQLQQRGVTIQGSQVQGAPPKQPGTGPMHPQVAPNGLVIGASPPGMVHNTQPGMPPGPGHSGYAGNPGVVPQTNMHPGAPKMHVNISAPISGPPPNGQPIGRPPGPVMGASVGQMAPRPGMPKYQDMKQQQMLQMQHQQQLKQQPVVGVGRGAPIQAGQGKIPISIQPSSSIAQLQNQQQYAKR